MVINRPVPPSARLTQVRVSLTTWWTSAARCSPGAGPDVLLAPLELLAVVWSVPFLILLVSIPAVLVVALIYQLGRLVVGYF